MPTNGCPGVPTGNVAFPVLKKHDYHSERLNQNRIRRCQGLRVATGVIHVAKSLQCERQQKFLYKNVIII